MPSPHDPPRFRIHLNILQAAVAFGLAAALLFSSGLPERADYTGWRLPGQGAFVAPEQNALAPPITAETITGETIDLWSLRDEPVIVYFWATWCVPCQQEMPELQELYTKYQAQGLHILAVNRGENRARIEQWRQALNLTFDLILDPQDTLTEDYYLRGTPSTFIINPEGIIDRVFYGPVTANTLEDVIGAYLIREET